MHTPVLTIYLLIFTVLEQWEKIHGKNTGYQLIEPVDGFHPNQVNSIL